MLSTQPYLFSFSEDDRNCNFVSPDILGNSDYFDIEVKMKLASFDLEIAKEIPEASDWKEHLPLGISCSAVAKETGLMFWYGKPQMDRTACRQMVNDFLHLKDTGYTFLTWNGLGFDFAVLAEESGMYAECAELALDHVDMMFMVVAERGHYLGLDKALSGAGVKGKLHEVTLNDGTVLAGMSGAKAPELWSKGEYDAVLAYLKDDVLQPLELAQKIQKTKVIRFGKRSIFFPEGLLTVRQCFDLSLPTDTSWMTDPPKRQDFIAWMPEKFRKEFENE